MRIQQILSLFQVQCIKKTDSFDNSPPWSMYSKQEAIFSTHLLNYLGGFRLHYCGWVFLLCLNVSHPKISDTYRCKLLISYFVQTHRFWWSIVSSWWLRLGHIECVQSVYLSCVCTENRSWEWTINFGCLASEQHQLHTTVGCIHFI